MLLQRTLCVLAANACLGLLTAFHLAYLGLMFDSSSDQDQVCVYRIGNSNRVSCDALQGCHLVSLATLVF